MKLISFLEGAMVDFCTNFLKYFYIFIFGKTDISNPEYLFSC